MITSSNPLLRISSIFLVALSLSIGWGIRGNFGHESGAMIAGVLSAVAVAVLSRRADWQRRTGYFALFGGLAWGFGGSISYMYPLSFTESGHTASTYYGFFAVFLEGGLWCGLGAAGTALAATMPLNRLQAMFVPLCFVLAAMGVRHWLEGPLEDFLTPEGDDTSDNRWHRHESPLYWFDADWLQACIAFAGVCIFDLYDRWKHGTKRLLDKPLTLLPFLSAGALLGFLVQQMLRLTGLEQAVQDMLVVKLGDLSYANPETGNRFAPDQLLTNWPQFFGDYGQHIGWGIGLIVGGLVYFGMTGRFRRDSSLFVYLSLGWLSAFILLPVLGSIFLMEYGGLRVMPPRSDDWAGILGVFVAGLIWSKRHGLLSVSHVMSRAFLLGGTTFAAVPMIRFLLRYPGHPWRFPDGIPESFQHYQSANWHSILEQMHGFGFGLSIAIVMAMLWRRQPMETKDESVREWTTVFSIAFAIFGIGYLNFSKLVGTWVERKAVPESLKLPLWDIIDASPLFWFRVVWLSAAVVFSLLMWIHLRRRLEIVPTSWIGKGQLIFVLFLWLVVIGNLQRAIPGFSNNRMVTEWVLFMNACLATCLVVALPKPQLARDQLNESLTWRSLPATWIGGLFVTSLLMTLFAFTTLSLYQEHLEGMPWANHRRFGPEAKWRVDPILKHGDHP